MTAGLPQLVISLQSGTKNICLQVNKIHYLQWLFIILSMAILSIDNLTKNYRKVKALDKVSFSVPPKTVFGILRSQRKRQNNVAGNCYGCIKSFWWYLYMGTEINAGK